MKNTLTLIVMLCFSMNTYAQLELAGMDYSNFLSSKITDAGNGQEVGFQEYRAFVNLPKKLKNGKTTLINGLSYGLVQSSLDNALLFEDGKAEKSFHSISYSLTLVHQLNQKWNFLLQFKPTIASDLEADLSSDDFLYLGTAMLTRKLGAHIVLGGGVIYTTQTGEPLVLPALKFQHKSRRHDLDIMLPSHIKFLHGLGARKKFSIGAQAAMNGGNYNISLTENAPVNPTVFDKLIYSRTNVGLLAKVRMYRVIQLELFGGYSLGRAFKFGTGDERLDYDVDNGPFFSVGVSLVPKPRGEGSED